jgi:hypothetical protein
VRLPKDELVERTLAAEQAFVQEPVHRLRTADELLTWMLITGPVIACINTESDAVIGSRT